MFIRTFAGGLFLFGLMSGVAFADCSLSADAQNGQKVVAACKSCHEFAADKPSKATAPNIHDVYGSNPGSRADFAKYSDGMKGAGAKKAVWNEASIFEYLADPSAYLTKVNGSPMKGNMLFKLADEQKRKDAIAYLKAIKGKAECN